MNEAVVETIKDYIDKYLFDPGSRWPSEEFEERSYARWSAYEILNRISDRPFDPADITIEGFLIEVSAHDYVYGDSKQSRLFQVAKDTAEEIMWLLV